MVRPMDFFRCDGTTENLAACLENGLVALIQFIAKIHDSLIFTALMVDKAPVA
jgi:hypothetical protein